MDTIFFEKQEAQLCAQHALNALLQGAYYNAADLADIGHRLDAAENQVLDEGSRNKQSMNMNDSGFFSVQVMAEALKTFHLDLTPITHPSVAAIRENPATARGFICNMDLHWFTLRKFGNQWFELNSLKDGPILLTDTYVSLYLRQLTDSGYTIHVVQGVYPESEADAVISLCPIDPALARNTPPPRRSESQDIQEAIKRSLMEANANQSTSDMEAIAAALNDEDDDRQLQMALMMSMAGSSSETPSTSFSASVPSSVPSASRTSASSAASSSTAHPPSSSDPSGPTAEEMRQKRLQRFT